MLTLPNVQHTEERDYRDDGSLDVVDVFDTFQGEGPFAGTPAVFVRLAGCNLTCPGCDTDYTSRRSRFYKTDLLNPIRRLRSFGLVVLTGGEPFRQNIGPLTELLIDDGYSVQVETNGTYYLYKFPYKSDQVSVVVSPKTPAINPSLLPYVHSYKFILKAGFVDQKDGLPFRTLGRENSVARPPVHFPKSGVFVQPADEQDPIENEKNLHAAMESCRRFGYRLSLQLHKQLGLA
jgi:7-carboxy-7-deazaguanine synthase